MNTPMAMITGILYDALARVIIPKFNGNAHTTAIVIGTVSEEAEIGFSQVPELLPAHVSLGRTAESSDVRLLDLVVLGTPLASRAPN